MKTITSIAYACGTIVAMLLLLTIYKTFDVSGVLFLSPLIALFGCLPKKQKLKNAIALGSVIYATSILAFGILKLRHQITIDLFVLTIGVYFILQLVFSIVAPKIQPNDCFGIRTPFTLDYPNVWKRTHIFLSVLETFSLPFLLILLFFCRGWGRFGLGTLIVLLPLLSAMVYSTIIGIRYQNKDNE